MYISFHCRGAFFPAKNFFLFRGKFMRELMQLNGGVYIDTQSSRVYIYFKKDFSPEKHYRKMRRIVRILYIMRLRSESRFALKTIFFFTSFLLFHNAVDAIRVRFALNKIYPLMLTINIKCLQFFQLKNTWFIWSP